MLGEELKFAQNQLKVELQDIRTQSQTEILQVRAQQDQRK